MRHRVSLENGESDFERDEYLLDIGEALLNQCKFLETKLSLEVRIYLFHSTLPTLVN